MKLSVETTACERKTQSKAKIVVHIKIDEVALAKVLGQRAVSNRSKQCKALRGIIRAGVDILEDPPR